MALFTLAEEYPARDATAGTLAEEYPARDATAGTLAVGEAVAGVMDRYCYQ